jgi:cytoskeleton protein RodZ
MGELGTWLKETREAQGLSTEQVEADTRIRRAFLQALEEGDYHILPGEVYVRGFLRNYALFLGLDPTEVRRRYEEGLSQGLAPRVQERSGYRPIDAALETSTHSVVTYILRALLVLLLLTLVGGVVAWWYWYDFALPRLPSWWPPRINTLSPGVRSPQNLLTPEPPLLVEGQLSGPATAAPAPATPTVTPSPKLIATSAVLPLPIPTSLPTATPTFMPTPLPPLPAQAEGIQLRVQVFERAWMQVTVDGEVDLAEILEAGEDRTWEAQQSISLRCGNAGGVLVTVNDEELGSLGERGQVIDWTWVAQGDRIAVVTPSPS